MTDFLTTPDTFGLLHEDAFADDRPVSTYHLLCLAHAANNLAHRPWRWCDLTNIRPNASPAPGGSVGVGYFSPSNLHAPFGRLDLPKPAGYNRTEGRVHIRVAPQTGVKVGVRVSTSKGFDQKTVGAGDWWLKFDLPVSTGTEDYLEIQITSTCEQLASIEWGPNTFKVITDLSLPTLYPDNYDFTYLYPERIYLFRKVSGMFSNAFTGVHLYDAGGYDLDFYDTSTSITQVRRRIIDHYWHDAHASDPRQQYFHFDTPLSDEELAKLNAVKETDNLQVEIKERARWDIPSAHFWVKKV